MYTRRSPPKQKKTTMGGSSMSSTCSSKSKQLQLAPTSTTESAIMETSHSPTNRHSGGSTTALYPSSSMASLLTNSEKNYQQQHHAHAHHHHHHYYRHERDGNGGHAASSSSSTAKRGKKHNWGTRKRAGMSFLIVIAFFAIFGLIILTEVFMIDERSHTGMNYGGYYGGRLGDSLPDYDEVKEDYDIMDGNFLSDSKLGFIQFRDNKLKIQDAVNSDGGRLAGILRGPSNGVNGFSGGVGGVGVGVGVGAGSTVVKGMAGAAGSRAVMTSYFPWGKVLSAKDEETLPPYPIGMVPTDGAWQVVNGTRFKFFVFSAYYDRRDGGRLVRVIGATKTRSPERVWCRFWYVNRNVSAGEAQRPRYSSVTVMALVKTIRENWNLKYSACFVICPLRAAELEVPQYVSIVARLRAPPGNVLELRNTDWDVDFTRNRFNATSSTNNTTTHTAVAAYRSYIPAHNNMVLSPPPTGEQLPDKIAVCVKPFHFDYDQALYLMEYLELYALLGVSHFTFYNHTIGPRATCVLQHYMSGDVPGNLTAWDEEEPPKVPVAPPDVVQNQSSSQPAAPVRRRFESKHFEKPTVTILPWNLRMRSQKEIRTEGLFAALNDCLYRSMYRYKYVALVDLDEFIVPRQNDTLIELISSLNQRLRTRNTGGYSFQNAFFYLQFPDDPLMFLSKNTNAEALRLRAALVTQRKTRRRAKLHPQKQRSKYICRPEAVVEAGNHFVWEFAAGKGTLNVPPGDAILQHYRVCEFGGNDCIKAPSIVDRTTTKYKNRLVQRVELVYKHLQKTCDLPDLPVLPKQIVRDVKKTKSNEALKRSNEQTRPLTDRNENVVVTNTKLTGKVTAFNVTSSTAITTSSTTTTTTTTTRSMATSHQSTLALTNTTTNKTETTAKNAARTSEARRRHKYVVFQHGEDGHPVAKVEYEYK